MTTMRAKMKVTNVDTYKSAEEPTITAERLTFRAVCKDEPYPADGSDEDNSFAKWTPNAELIMTVTNPDLFGKFTSGDTFYLDFVKVE